jgi:hypothetical protein
VTFFLVIELGVLHGGMVGTYLALREPESVIGGGFSDYSTLY